MRQPTQSDTEDRFRLLVESIKDYAIFMLDPHGNVATWNTGAERIKGYRTEEILGKHFSIFYPPDVVASGKCELELEVAAREGRFEDEDWRIRKDGSRLWANVVITALRNPDGSLLGFAKITRDLTERRNTEENLQALAAERAALLEKSRTHEFQERFVAILGHDLRNPLAAIETGTGLLLQRASDPITIRVVERMRSSASRMSRMIAQIMDLTRSRLTSGLGVQPLPGDLRDALLRIADELRSAHPTRTILIDCPHLPGRWDKDRMEQVFSNLIGNALHYGDESHPVSVSADIQAESIVIEFHNTGEPIPDEMKSKLFDAFRRGERDSRSSKTLGLGLGLYISKEIVQAHGGDIEVHSSLANGTTFRVTLPKEGEP